MGLSTFEVFKHVSDADGAVKISPEMLDELHNVLQLMLSDINEVCLDNNIPYVMGGGSCLGAVRHRGFIPWDDDLDINMTRSGFAAFSKAFLRRFGDKYWVHQPGVTPGYELAFPRVRLKETVVRCRDDYDSTPPEWGAYIDIFYIDNIPNNTVARLFHGSISMGLGFAYSCRRFAAHSAEYMALVSSNQTAAKTFRAKILLGKILSFRSAVAWTNTWDRWNGRCRNESSKYVSIPVGRRHYFKETYLRSDYFPVSRGEFERLSVPLPANPDKYMRALYGDDYMTPPPVEERETHVVTEFDLGQYTSVADRTNAQ